MGAHLVKRLKADGYWVRAIDIKNPEFAPSAADEYIVGDLRKESLVQKALEGMHEVYQMAADMGGIGYISGANDADILYTSTLINLQIARASVNNKVEKLFYPSSACVYPTRNLLDPENPKSSEDSAYPADPDSDYGWEKLYAERIYQAHARNYKLNVKIARFHTVFGPEGTWQGGREKVYAALCRKVAQAPDGGEIEVWGKGDQTRTFIHIDECLEGVRRLMESDFSGPVNIGSEEMISINDLANLIIEISGKNLSIRNVPGPEGVRGRTSDNTLIRERLNWAPSQPLRKGLEITYAWISGQVKQAEKIPQTAIS